jgi:hypothetical protein
LIKALLKKGLLFSGKTVPPALIDLPSIWDPRNGTPTGDPKEPIEDFGVENE